MADREKVIKALECCMSGQPNGLGCDRVPCPYNEFEDCEGMLHRDTLAVLKPRVLTLDEVIQWEGAFWLEYIEEDSNYLCCWGYAFFSCASQNVIELIVRDGYRPLYSFIRSEYGVRWRCWAARPTDEQREATPWES